jgi:hypothetical protein
MHACTHVMYHSISCYPTHLSAYNDGDTHRAALSPTKHSVHCASRTQVSAAVSTYPPSDVAAGQQLGCPGGRAAQLSPPGPPHLPRPHAAAVLRHMVPPYPMVLLPPGRFHRRPRPWPHPLQRRQHQPRWKPHDVGVLDAVPAATPRWPGRTP